MQHDILSVLSRFSPNKILVIGDFILDTYRKGCSKRISPEAPVPVVDISRTDDRLGGAANVALNLKALGAEVLFCTALGDDNAGERGLALLKAQDIPTGGAIQCTGRATQEKTRVMAGNQLLVRYDVGDMKSLTSEEEKKVIRYIRDAYALCDAVLIADYAKGMLSAKIIRTLTGLNRQAPKFIAIDSKRLQDFKALHPSLVKPNDEEARQLLVRSVPFREDRVERWKTLGKPLHKKTNAHFLALTLDQEGAIWFEHGLLKTYQDVKKTLLPFVSGAGDTYIGAALLAMISGATIEQAAIIANAAAGIVINKEDTACCSFAELTECFFPVGKLYESSGILSELCRQWKRAGKKVIFTNGCYDILHSGHIHFLQRSKALGDILIVGLNSDDSVRRLKGAGRPVNRLDDRIKVLSAIRYVDYIIPFGTPESDTAEAILRSLQPDMFVKGEDYRFRNLAESQVLTELNIPLRLLPVPTHQSTSEIIHRIRENKFTAA